MNNHHFTSWSVFKPWQLDNLERKNPSQNQHFNIWDFKKSWSSPTLPEFQRFLFFSGDHPQGYWVAWWMEGPGEWVVGEMDGLIYLWLDWRGVGNLRGRGRGRGHASESLRWQAWEVASEPRFTPIRSQLGRESSFSLNASCEMFSKRVICLPQQKSRQTGMHLEDTG